MWIKLCGMNDESAIEAALLSKVDAAGFVIAPSVRAVTSARAAELAAPLRGRITCIAVTLHPDSDLIEKIFCDFNPDLLQIDLADLSRVPRPYRSRILPVVRDADLQPARLDATLRQLPQTGRVLCEGTVSGSGYTADWSRVRELATRREVVLAGGLTPENISTAIDAVRPFGVDVSSGIESSPGRKCPRRIAAFVSAARAAFAPTSNRESST